MKSFRTLRALLLSALATWAAASPANAQLLVPAEPGKAINFPMAPRDLAPCVYLPIRDCVIFWLVEDSATGSPKRGLSGSFPFEVYLTIPGQPLLANGTVTFDPAIIGQPPYTRARLERGTRWTFTSEPEDFYDAAHRVNWVTYSADDVEAQLREAQRARQRVMSNAARYRAEFTKIGAGLQAIAGELAALERGAQPLLGGAGPRSCDQALTLQSQLRTMQASARAKVGELQGDAASMRGLIAACKTAADVEALRIAWARSKQRGDELASLLGRAGALRQQMTAEVMKVRPAERQTDASMHQTSLGQMLTRLAPLRAAVSGRFVDASIEADIPGHTQRLAVAEQSLATGLRQNPQNAIKEPWMLDALRPTLMEAQLSLTAARSSIDKERADMAVAVKALDEVRDLRGRASLEADALIDRITKLDAGLSASTCSFTDDLTLYDLQESQRNADRLLDETDRIFSVSDRCTTSTRPVVPEPRVVSEPPAPPRNRTAPVTPVAQGQPQMLTATLECNGRIEVVAGGRPETCGVRVSGWDSRTTEPVRIRLQPPFTAASGLRAAPGDTEQGGDVLYASAINDKRDYVFGEGFSAVPSAPTGTTTIVIIVSQGQQQRRLPLTIGVRAARAPTDITIENPTTDVAGSGGQYCVWQYKLFGDPPGCWHMAAAACTSPRYSGVPEYVRVGNNMTRSQADRRVDELSYYFNNGACRATMGTNPFGPNGPNVNTNPPNPAGTPANLSADLQCGGELEIVAGGRVETCGVRVRGWRSNTRTPVEIIFDPPFSRESRIRIAPGDTSQGGDALYASGVNDRSGEYVFGEGFSAERGAPETRNAITVIVRQGNAEVRLPLQVNVVPPGSPPGTSLVPPTPNVAGSGGPYCVWQYKLFGDPPPCWHLAAAGCTEPRYANRREYVMVGNNMSRSDADRRIGELSRYFNDMSCRQVPEKEPPVVTSVTGPVAVAPPVTPPQPPSEPDPPRGPTSRFSRFGISPRDSTIRVGQTIALKAYATANGAPDMVLTLDEREVRWSGDKPPTFTATEADAGRTYRITATGPAGESDTVTILVERATTTATAAPAPGPVVNGPAPAGALGLIDKVIKPSRSDGQHVTTLGDTTCETRFVETPKNFRITSWTFAPPPPHLEAGQTYELAISASLQQEPRLGSQSYPNVGVIYFDGLNVTKDSTPAQAIITNGQAIATPGRYRFTLRPGVTKAVIAFACDGPGTFATYTYGRK
jgi:hypothetical protein